MQLFDGIPRIAIIAVVILALIGAVWFWKRWSKSAAVDQETENIKAQQHAAVYAQNVARGLDPEDSNDDDAEYTGAVTDEYTQDVSRGLEAEDSSDAEDDLEDDEEYEPMD